MTPDTNAVDESWRSSWAQRIPSSSHLGIDRGDSGVGFTFLPDGRKYPTEDGDLESLIAGYRSVLDVLMSEASVDGAPLLLISHGWKALENGKPVRDELLASLSPEAIYWRTDDTALEPGFTSLLHSYYQTFNRAEDVLLIIELFCIDSTDNIIIAASRFEWTMVLRNGGLELLTEDPKILGRVVELAEAHPKWSARTRK